MLRSALHALRTVLFDPATFFERNPPEDSFLGALAAVSAVAVLSSLVLALIGVFLASRIDATVTVTTLEPWSESICQSYAEMEGPLPEPCTIDEPQTKQVSVGAKLQSAVFGRIPFAFFGTYVGWLLVAVGLHAVTAFTSGSGSFGDTLVVTGWATPAQLVSTLFGVVGIALAFGGVDFASDPELLADQLRRLANTSSSALGVLGTFVGVAWQAYIWTHGLHESHDSSLGGAATAAGIVGVVLFVLSLA
ncbi:Yip1 family protein [Halobacterium wangiae]|uniref:Yip1 family protein n=1 Tax=Halobacterium wangiae TaxID=2902623 RepID=UPI001E474C21|nr:Yip1 family protein [Halobacterium wangiae]